MDRGDFADDPEFLHRFRAGDQRALEATYCHYRDRVERFLRSRACWPAPSGADAPEVEDLVQEVFLRALAPRARMAYDGMRPFSNYLLTIARNAAVEWLRKRRTIAIRLPDEDLEVRLPAWCEEPWARAAHTTAVRRAVATLPPRLQTLYQERYVHGRSQRAAATTLGIGRQVVRRLEEELYAHIRWHLRDPEIETAGRETIESPTLDGRSARREGRPAIARSSPSRRAH